MEYFSDPDINKSKQSLYSVLISACVHLLIIIITMSLPFFVTRSSAPVNFVDVMLFETVGPEITSDPGSEQKDISKPEAKPTPVPQRQELTDPSEAELDRMRRRQATPTPAPRTSHSDEFDIESSHVPVNAGRASGSMQVDVKNFPYHYYLTMLRSRVSENWIPPFGIFEEDQKRVVVAFRIDRQGNQHAVRIEESSGDPLLDQSALRAVTVSSPFPPLPESFTGASLGVFFGFSVQL